MDSGLAARLTDFAAWRDAVAARIGAYQSWLSAQGLDDGQAGTRLADIRARLQDERLVLAVAAEFSRGKSELINAIFFADYGRRILPTASGRTTMCPTELAWDPTAPPGLRLLPIETRARGSLAAYREMPEEWTTVAFPEALGTTLGLAAGLTAGLTPGSTPGSTAGPPDGPERAAALAMRLQAIQQTRRVPLSEARRLGLHSLAEGLPGEDPEVLIPVWRHAIVNIRHPLLEQGLVVLDTPGFNALGAEMDLALELLPGADAIIYVLALDTGVTQSDLNVWNNLVSVCGVRQTLRFAALNKIDSIWDGLRSEEDIEAEILQQRARSAAILGIEPEQLFPVSAQKGLVAKIRGEAALLDRSRLPLLEQAISNSLLPRRRQILCDWASEETAGVMGRVRARLEQRLDGLAEQLAELRSLHGRNAGVADDMTRRALIEKDSFEQGLAKLQSLRASIAEFSNALFVELGVDSLSRESRQMLQSALASPFRFTSDLHAVMQGFLADCHQRLDAATARLAALQGLIGTLYAQFEAEHQLRLGAPASFSMLRFERELERLEEVYNLKFKSLRALLGSDDRSLLHKFIQTIVGRIYEIFALANSGTDRWLKAVLAPVEAQIRDRQQQIHRRLESIRQIRSAAATLGERVAELEQLETGLLARIVEHSTLAEELARALALEDALGADAVSAPGAHAAGASAESSNQAA